MSQRRTLLGFAAVAGCIFAAATTHAQQVDHYSPQSLTEQAKPLQEKATATHGSASETLQKYGVDYTMLAFRNQDGNPEMHAHFADIFVVVDGSATLLSNGELDHPRELSPGESTGAALLHPTETHLAKGDVVHIPPGTPHQLLIPKGSTFTYFVIKIKEKE